MSKPFELTQPEFKQHSKDASGYSHDEMYKKLGSASTFNRLKILPEHVCDITGMIRLVDTDGGRDDSSISTQFDDDLYQLRIRHKPVKDDDDRNAHGVRFNVIIQEPYGLEKVNAAYDTYVIHSNSDGFIDFAQVLRPFKNGKIRKISVAKAKQFNIFIHTTAEDKGKTYILEYLDKNAKAREVFEDSVQKKRKKVKVRRRKATHKTSNNA